MPVTHIVIASCYRSNQPPVVSERADSAKQANTSYKLPTS